MSGALTPRRVRRARRIIAADRCPSARNPGVRHKWQYAFYSLIGEGYECLVCGECG